MNTRTIGAAAVAGAVLALGVATGVNAKVTESEAQQLKTTLMPFGGERAGNADGSIPAWSGGIAKDPNYVSGTQRTDPFKDERPLFSITGANADKYAAHLSEGQISMLKKYPDFRMDVYPTHRTASAPQYAIDATYANALTAEVSADGRTLTNAAIGVPFPIPKSGVEAMWNVTLKFMPPVGERTSAQYTVDGNGTAALAGRVHQYDWAHYFYAGATYQDLEKKWDDVYGESYLATIDPPFRSGEALLVKMPMDYAKGGTKAWTYLSGQRRVRRSPNLDFDVPNPVMSGQVLMDEVQVFLGSPERFDWKILGKKEIYIPYNTLKMFSDSAEAKVGPHSVKPDYVRYELHRVWVVEGTLKQGMRHIEPRKIFYLDEDTYIPALGDFWDAHGQLWKHAETYHYPAVEVPLPLANTYAVYDLLAGSYVVDQVFGTEDAQRGQMQKIFDQAPEKLFTPEGVAAAGVR